MKTDLFIIAAGNGSRMGGSLPKALVPITSEPNATTTIRQAFGKFRKIFVVTNEMSPAKEYWQDYFDNQLPEEFKELVVNVPITSGFGDGHAVLQGMIRCPIKVAADVVICWGDVFIQHEGIFTEILQRGCDYGVIPARFEKNPYVTLKMGDLGSLGMSCTGAEFSKHGELNDEGWHDQSVFRFDSKILYKCLFNLDAALWKHDKYMTPGHELSLLHAFHYLSNVAMHAQIYQTEFPTLSFNTPDEVKEIQQQILLRW